MAFDISSQFTAAVALPLTTRSRGGGQLQKQNQTQRQQGSSSSGDNQCHILFTDAAARDGNHAPDEEVDLGRTSLTVASTTPLDRDQQRRDKPHICKIDVPGKRHGFTFTEGLIPASPRLASAKAALREPMVDPETARCGLGSGLVHHVPVNLLHLTMAVRESTVSLLPSKFS